MRTPELTEPTREASIFVRPNCGYQASHFWHHSVDWNEGRLLSAPAGRGSSHALAKLELSVAMCLTCKGYSVWMDRKIIYPLPRLPVEASHTDMSEEVKKLYEEAATVLESSPRSAAVSIRAALQVLLRHIWHHPTKPAPTGHLYADIRSWVEARHSQNAVVAADLIRLLVNGGAHPARVVLKQAPEDATELFFVLNMLTNEYCDSLPQKRELKELRAKIPQNKITK